MRRLVFVMALSLLASPALAEKGVRVSFENILTGPSVGTDNLYAFQLEMEVTTLGPVDIGLSLGKEGSGSVEGYKVGVHASRHWRHKDARLNFVTQGGVKFLIPGVEYNRFRFAERDTEVIWQRWDRISTNFHFPFGGETANVAGAATWGPQFGLFAEVRAWKFRFRAGIRGTFHQYGTEIMHRPPGSHLRLLRNDRHWRLILAPTISVGF